MSGVYRPPPPHVGGRLRRRRLAPVWLDTVAPAGATIKATFVVVSGTTDGSGDISSSYTWAADQPVAGRARKASSGPPYKTAKITTTINASSGRAVTVQMIPD